MADFHCLLLAATAVFLVARSLLRRRRASRRSPPLLACGWLLTGEIYATVGNTDEANSFAKVLPPPRNWVDLATHGAPVTFLGQALTNESNQLWLTEFWNRSIGHVASLDGTAPGPGPTTAPGLDTTDGALSGYTGDPYTLAGNGVLLAAPVVAARAGFDLYRTPRPWRLLDEEQNVFADGWATSPINYTYFPPGGPGVLDGAALAHRLQRPGAARAGDDPRRHRCASTETASPSSTGSTAVRAPVVRNGEERQARHPRRRDAGDGLGGRDDVLDPDRFAAARRAAGVLVPAGPRRAPPAAERAGRARRGAGGRVYRPAP